MLLSLQIIVILFQKFVFFHAIFAQFSILKKSVSYCCNSLIKINQKPNYSHRSNKFDPIKTILSRFTSRNEMEFPHELPKRPQEAERYGLQRAESLLLERGLI